GTSAGMIHKPSSHLHSNALAYTNRLSCPPLRIKPSLVFFKSLLYRVTPVHTAYSDHDLPTPANAIALRLWTDAFFRLTDKQVMRPLDSVFQPHLKRCLYF